MGEFAAHQLLLAKVWPGMPLSHGHSKDFMSHKFGDFSALMKPKNTLYDFPGNLCAMHSCQPDLVLDSMPMMTCDEESGEICIVEVGA